METMYTLCGANGFANQLEFGMPQNSTEVGEMFDFRYRVYREKGYIDPKQVENDIDEYDRNGCCQYFVAKRDDSIIGTMRLIQDAALPIFNYFRFDERDDFQRVPRGKRCEIGRLIVSHCGQDTGGLLPRGLVTLFLIKCAADYAKKQDIKLHLAFIKSKLQRKMKKRKMPVNHIQKYEQYCPAGDLLYDYFNNPQDPVAPVYFLTGEFERYLKKILNNVFFDIRNGVEFHMKNNLFTRALFCK